MNFVGVLLHFIGFSASTNASATTNTSRLGYPLRRWSRLTSPSFLLVHTLPPQPLLALLLHLDNCSSRIFIALNIQFRS